MDILFDNVSPADATVYTREWANRLDTDPNTGPSLATFLPNRTVQGIKSRQTRVSRTPQRAKFRAFDAPTPIGRRPIAIAVKEIGLAPLGQVLPQREVEILNQALANGDWSEIIEQVYDDLKNNVDAIHNTIEVLRSQFLNSGVVTINENGVIQEADFGLAEDHNLSLADVGTPWSDESADSITQEQEWVRQTRQDADAPVIAAITSQRVLNAMMRHTVYTNPTALIVNRSQRVFNEYRTEAGLPPIFVYDKQIDGENLLDDSKIHYVTRTVGETQWGTTVEALELFGSNAIDESSVDQPAIASSVWRSKNPVNIWSKSDAIALPVAGDINGLFVAQVLAESVES